MLLSVIRKLLKYDNNNIYNDNSNDNNDNNDNDNKDANDSDNNAWYGTIIVNTFNNILWTWQFLRNFLQSIAILVREKFAQTVNGHC